MGRGNVASRLYALVVVGEGAAGEAVLVEGVGEAVVLCVVHLVAEVIQLL